MAVPLPAPVFASFHQAETWVSAVVSILILSLFIFFAAKFVLGRTSLIASILTALLGTILATLAAGLVPGPDWLDLVVFIAVWALVAAIFFRTAWVRGAIIGLVAAILMWLVGLVIGLVWAG